MRLAMNASEMIRLMNQVPFAPLEIHLSDGAVIRVEHQYEIATRPSSPSCIVYDEAGHARFIAYRNITEVITTTPTG
jgi:hypothetical protein